MALECLPRLTNARNARKDVCHSPVGCKVSLLEQFVQFCDSTVLVLFALFKMRSNYLFAVLKFSVGANLRNTLFAFYAGPTFRKMQ